MKILMPLPYDDFDPTEIAVPACVLADHGHQLVFATPNGNVAYADDRMVTGRGLALLKPFLMADAVGLNAYRRLLQMPAFLHPIAYARIEANLFDGLVLGGGHASGMKVYLESPYLQNVVVAMMQADRPVGAICHGLVLAARSRDRKTGRSVLQGRKVTSLQNRQELFAWSLTCAWLGDYYRTYQQTVEDEVKNALEHRDDFQYGPLPVFRDSTKNRGPGFAVRDGNFVSARWPGDAHCFAYAYLDLLPRDP